jgi:hypothetical protein
MVYASYRDVSISAVLNKTFGILSRHIITFSILSLVSILPTILIGIGMRKVTPGANMTPEMASQFGMGMLAAFAWSLLVFPGVFGATAHIAFQDMRGRQASVSEGFRLGYSRALSMFGVFFLIFGGLALIGVLLSLVSFVLGPLALLLLLGLAPLAIVLALRWYVALQVCLVERAGPLQSLARSRDLTNGYKWSILGVLAICMVVWIIIRAVPMLLLLKFPLLQLAVDAISLIAISAYSTILGVVIYHDLRTVKEGVDIEGIASVFD